MEEKLLFNSHKKYRHRLTHEVVSGEYLNDSNPPSIFVGDWEEVPEPKSTPKQEQTLGRKYDSDKPRWGLLPYRELEDIVKVLTFGSKKYADDNWKHVENGRERYFDAMMRHINEYRQAKQTDNPDKKYDDETGLNHLSHAMCCALFLMWLDNEGVE